MRDPNQEKQQKFLEIYDSFSDEIFRFCLSKTRNRDESLDITQETFVKTWDYMRANKTIDMARPFLYRTARNIIIDHSRKKKAVSLDAIFEKGTETETSYEADESVSIPTGRHLDQEVLLQKLKELPEHHYEILVLRYIQELTLSEIAKMYKESENTISVKIHRAIKLAQKLFPEEDNETSRELYEP